MIDELTPAVLRFNEALRSKIVEILMGRKPRLSHPNESTIAICEPWSSNSTILPLQPDLVRSLNSRQQGPSDSVNEATLWPGGDHRAGVDGGRRCFCRRGQYRCC